MNSFKDFLWGEIVKLYLFSILFISYINECLEFIAVICEESLQNQI